MWKCTTLNSAFSSSSAFAQWSIFVLINGWMNQKKRVPGKIKCFFIRSGSAETNKINSSVEKSIVALTVTFVMRLCSMRKPCMKSINCEDLNLCRLNISFVFSLISSIYSDFQCLRSTLFSLIFYKQTCSPCCAFYHFSLALSHRIVRQSSK